VGGLTSFTAPKVKPSYLLHTITVIVQFVACDEVTTQALTLKLPTTTIVAQPFNIIKWQLKYNPVA